MALLAVLATVQGMVAPQDFLFEAAEHSVGEPAAVGSRPKLIHPRILQGQAVQIFRDHDRFAGSSRTANQDRALPLLDRQA